MSVSALERVEFNPDCLRAFDAAQGMAEITNCDRIHPPHLLLATLSEPGGYLDGMLVHHFGGLKAATVAESLRDILELDPPGEDSTAGLAGDLFQMNCTASTLAVVTRAVELAKTWGTEKVKATALIRALLEQPDRYALDAFRDAGLGERDLKELATKITERDEGKTLEVLDEGRVCLGSFGPVASDALLALTRMGQGRTLVAEDLFIAFLSDERSLTVESLQVMGAKPGTLLQMLSKRYGGISGPRGTVLECSRLGKMLIRILEQAAKLAAGEHADKIGESHLVRTYIAKVGAEPGNVLEKASVPYLRLAESLKKHKADREANERTPDVGGMTQDVEGYLRQRVVGQEEAIRVVVPALQRMRLGMNEPGRPLGVFLFLGATGVGKTELAKAVADIAFGPKPGVVEPYLIRIDCGTLTEPRDIVQLLGAPQGLVGYKEGKLTNGLREKGGRCIVLFDEAEKANPKIWQSLLTFFDEGIVTEADGTRYDATGCILVATSNLGYKEAIDKFRLFDLSVEEMERVQAELHAFIWKRVEDYFSPEFRGRFGRQNVLFFNNFRHEHYRAMISSQVQLAVEDMAQRGIELTVAPAVLDVLEEMAWEERQTGAREVRRLVTRHVRDRIVDALVANPAQRRVELGASEEMLQFERRRASTRTLVSAGVDLEAMLKERIAGQDHVIRAVLPALKRMRAGLNEPGRLKGVFFFLGPTGVGKTELARTISEVAFGKKNGAKDPNLIVINCAALKDPHDIVQLLGAAQGYVGYKEGALTNGLRDKGNRCVILFDEAEKAHPKVWQSLLQLFDEGLVIEADGTQYDASGCILIATSNLGYKEAIDKFRLDERSAAELEQLRPKVEEFIWKRVCEYLSPELRGRFGRENILLFNNLTVGVYRELLEKQVSHLTAELRGRSITLTVDQAVLDAMVDLAWEHRAEGARPVRRLVTRYIRDLVVTVRVEDPECKSAHVSYTGDLATDHAAQLKKKKSESVDDIETYLNARVINQVHAVRLLVPAIKRMRMGMNEAGRMIGTSLFLGPSGVGKTELAKAVGDAAFGPKPGVVEPYLVRIDCGKLTEARDIVQLLGAPQGLVGYKEGTLTNGLRDKGGRCVIVFDEAEKADRAIWQSLLTFFDEGIVTEADGTRYDATGCLLIATSNLGCKEAAEAFRLFDLSAEDAQALRPQVEEFVWNKVTGYFSPEFLGRFGRENVVLFNHFRQQDYRAIIANQAAALTREMNARGLECTVDEAVIDKLVEFAWERRAEGARRVRRLLTSYVRDQIVDGLEADPKRTIFHFCVRDDGEIAPEDR